MLTEDDEAAVKVRRAQRTEGLEAVQTAAAMACQGVETTLGASYMCQDPDDGSSPEEPEYNPETNDTWRMRQQVGDRFVQAGRRVILQMRAEKRLVGVRRMMAAIGDKDKAAAYVAQELLSGVARNAGTKVG